MTHHILIVDDEDSNLVMLEEMLEEEGFHLTLCSNGEEGLEALEKNPEISAVLLDRMMPRMDGIQFLSAVRPQHRYRHLPVIMQTAASTDEQVQQGIEAGAYYYITKPYSKSMLLTILRKALRDFAALVEAGEAQGALDGALLRLTECAFAVRRLDDVKPVSHYLAKLYPEPSAAVVGITELILNALEHGNLGIGYDGKSTLVDKASWEREVLERLARAENQGKKVDIRLHASPSELVLTIKDEGQGFDWQPFMTFSPSRAFDNHGRGIALANSISFDNISYVPPGNQVICKKSRL